MWSYYGTKKKLAQHYPAPVYNTIIEPFAGAAQYSLYGNNWQRNVILVDKYPVITDLWNYLQSASESDILKLPDFKRGDTIDMHKQLIQPEKYLIGFCINGASSMPKKTASGFNAWSRYKVDIASNLHKIRHWKIINGDYNQIRNRTATWFIDPIYQYGGEHYRFSNKGFDYAKLKSWCMSRRGQVIVCENTRADWMDFRPLVNLNGQKRTTTEAIWLGGVRMK